MRVEALGYRAAHAAHQEVMRSGPKGGRGVCGSPLRFVARCHPGAPAASPQLYMAWPVSAYTVSLAEAPGAACLYGLCWSCPFAPNIMAVSRRRSPAPGCA